ncbi:hypothetical protein [Acidihalobacter prosperus]|uniref:Uncharacterized protein n=1 Tax=Acidihalobacter prosperus TaxID=160660 RepID=A0A1A6C0F5_9GAMM|nr:hypothetical protein [Acidihalobacter prosperus]OBS08042.1 hypothetical protein Thpro_022292 [Acidihalobacter prosperus]
MLTPKGREEILNLIESDLVDGWDEADRALRNVLRMLLTLRPDLVKLYFVPAAWQRIADLERRQAAAVILAAMKAAVVEANAVPPIAGWAQARFYLDTRVTRFADMARDWCAANPDACPERLRPSGSRRALPAASGSRLA